MWERRESRKQVSGFWFRVGRSTINHEPETRNQRPENGAQKPRQVFFAISAASSELVELLVVSSSNGLCVIESLSHESGKSQKGMCKIDYKIEIVLLIQWIVRHIVCGVPGFSVVALKKGEKAVPEEIIEFGRGKMAGYKIPKKVIVVVLFEWVCYC